MFYFFCFVKNECLLNMCSSFFGHVLSILRLDYFFEQNQFSCILYCMCVCVLFADVGIDERFTKMKIKNEILTRDQFRLVVVHKVQCVCVFALFGYLFCQGGSFCCLHLEYSS